MADTGNHPAPPSQVPPERTRWHSAPWWVGVSGLFTVVGVVVAILALVYAPQDNSDVSQPRPTEAAGPSNPGPPSPSTAGPASTTTPAVAPSAPSYLDPVTEELRLAPPSVGVSMWLDVDQPRVFRAASYEEEVEAKTWADLEYTSDGEFSTQFTREFARVGFVPAGDVTVDQCLAKVELQALGDHETVEVGRNICVVSAQGTVAWIRVTRFTEPRLYDNPTLLVRATIWKPADS
ncbi:hypothetical protein AB0J90_28890 [Micromonospora sp. NPDC049523]|uniref:hypothetical protein n=1 Tax=Micromonospora sp. NPDC049523 TaxID=3155921 RepID=UPI0034239DCE